MVKVVENQQACWAGTRWDLVESEHHIPVNLDFHTSLSSMTNVDSKIVSSLQLWVKTSKRISSRFNGTPGPHTNERASAIPKRLHTIAEAGGDAAVSGWKELLGNIEKKMWPEVFHIRNRNVEKITGI